MARAVAWLQAQLAQTDLAPRRRLRLAGQLGGYARMLGDFAAAHAALAEALRLADALGDAGARLANEIRLAHVYQWERNFAAGDTLFAGVLARVAADPAQARYRDFAYQHAGKNCFDQGRYAEAHDLFQAALAIRREKGDPGLIHSTQLALAAVARRLQDGDQS
jgi:tetratricopeptide (TPR) repeat protein